MRTEDKRLDTTVSVSESHIAIGELLDRFREQTGLALDVNSLDMSSGYDVFVQCDHVSVGQMMDALYSLVSTRSGEWKWLRQGKPDHYSYLLIESQPAKERPENYRSLARQIFRDLIRTMGRLSAMEPAERSRHKVELSAALKLSSDTILDNFLQEKDFWSGAKLFFGVLSSDQQDQVLAGGAALSFHADQLSAPMRTQYETLFAAGEHSSRQADGTYTLDPLPKEFTISLVDPVPGGLQLAQQIRIQYKDTIGMSMLGTGYSSYSLRATVLKDWMLPDDTKDDPAADRVVPTRSGDVPEPQLVLPTGHFYSPSAIAAHLKAIAARTSIPVLAVLPGNDQVDIGKPDNRKVADLLEQMERPLLEMYKWRGGVLLLNNPDRFLERVMYFRDTVWL
jgi:hypothetical protein